VWAAAGGQAGNVHGCDGCSFLACSCMDVGAMQVHFMSKSMRMNPKYLCIIIPGTRVCSQPCTHVRHQS
jgi:hypothetical protein